MENCPPQPPDFKYQRQLEAHSAKKMLFEKILEQFWTISEEAFYRNPNFFIKTLYASIRDEHKKF